MFYCSTVLQFQLLHTSPTDRTAAYCNCFFLVHDALTTVSHERCSRKTLEAAFRSPSISYIPYRGGATLGMRNGSNTRAGTRKASNVPRHLCTHWEHEPAMGVPTKTSNLIGWHWGERQHQGNIRYDPK